MKNMKVLWLIGFAVLVGLSTGCRSLTSVAIHSEPTGAWVYAKLDQPEFIAVRGAGKDGHMETPTSITLNWNTSTGDTGDIKVKWPDDMTESRVVTLKRGSPDVRILFTKGQEPSVEVIKK